MYIETLCRIKKICAIHWYGYNFMQDEDEIAKSQKQKINMKKEMNWKNSE